MNRKPSILVIFLTVFIDLVGFGIVVPLTPMFSRDFGATGWQLGLILASYSAMQFLFSPIWGKLSDRHGRRPILLISTAGAVVSYVIFALALQWGHLWLLLASRMFAGACGGQRCPQCNASAKMTYETTAPAVLMSRMGRRPWRSESFPQMGEKINCIAEYAARTTPSCQPDAPKSRLNIGVSGTTMPKPTRSMKTVRKMTRMEGLRFISNEREV